VLLLLLLLFLGGCMLLQLAGVTCAGELCAIACSSEQPWQVLLHCLCGFHCT
jgi:UPF0716 family protein affecting phage T7 exclusion